MKNVVTFETAVRLKEAGFLQPEPEVGQCWYNDTGLLGIIVKYEGFRLYSYCSFETGKTITAPEKVFYAAHNVFAPTAIEILRELQYADLTFRNGKFRVIFEHVMNRHDNPAEAAAAAWLELHEKKNLQK